MKPFMSHGKAGDEIEKKVREREKSTDRRESEVEKDTGKRENKTEGVALIFPLFCDIFHFYKL